MEHYSIAENDLLLRLMFGSEHYHLNEVKDAAISLQDLKERGFSLDVKNLAPKRVMEERIKSQVDKAIQKKGSDQEERKLAYITSLLNQELISFLDLKESQLFETSHDPVDGNDAHAKLVCVNKEETRSYYVFARNQLRPLLAKSICKFEDFEFKI